jgi:hypothetical protein
MTVYRYLLADLITNAVIAELPLTSVNYTQQLNSYGTCSAQIMLSDPGEANMNISAATIPGRTALYIDRDGVLVWGGIIWSRNYDSDNQSISIVAMEFESYFDHRRINTTQTFNNTDQLSIVRSLITTAQSVINGNIGIVLGTETSGLLINRTFGAYEQKTVYTAILELSQSGSGFDFAIIPSYSSTGAIVKTLQLGYPLLGNRWSASNASSPVFEFPAGNTVSYSYAEDGSIVANSFTAIGSGSNEGQQQQTATNIAQLQAGWPLLEDTANYMDINDLTLLGNLAVGRLAAVSNPPVALQMVVPPYSDPNLGTYAIGDDIRVRIRDDRFPNGLDAVYRLVALNVTPGEVGPERATLSLTLTTY